MQLLHLRTVKLLVYSVCLLINDISFAGAWLQPKGKSELIFQIENKELATYYKDSSNHDCTNSNRFGFDYYSLFYQYGLKNDTTIGFEIKGFNYTSYSSEKNSVLLKNNDPNDSFNKRNELYLDSHYKRYENEIFEYKVFAQREFWSDESSVISIKPSIGSFFTNDGINMVGLAILFGHNFKLGEKDAHINVEFGADNIFYSSLFDASDVDSIRSALDFTIGINMTERNMVLFQSLNHTDPLQSLKNPAEPHYNRKFSNMAQVSWVYEYSKNTLWQTGYSTNISDRDKYIVDSVMTGLWLRF